MISEPSACDGSTSAAHPEVMGADGICGFCPDTKSGADAGSPPPPHVRENILSVPICPPRVTLTVVVEPHGTLLFATYILSRKSLFAASRKLSFKLTPYNQQDDKKDLSN